MQICYKRKIINANIFGGLIWMVALLASFLLDSLYNLSVLFYVLMSVLYFTISLYQMKYQYLTLKNGTIKQNWPFGKKIQLEQIQKIRHFSGEYILKSKDKTLKIDIYKIAPKSLQNLKTELKKLNVDWV